MVVVMVVAWLVVVLMYIIQVIIMCVLQGQCEQRYKQCEKISLKETFDQVTSKHQRHASVL